MVSIRVEPVRRRLESVVRAGLGPAAYVEAALDVLARTVPFESACHGTLDPATGLLTGSVKRHLTSAYDEDFLLHEYVLDDVNLFADLARRPRPVGVLGEETGGDPRRSSRYRELFEVYGVEHELRAALVVAGVAWATLALYRESGPAAFTRAEADVVAAVAPLLAVGARTAAVTARARAELARPEAGGPGVLVVDDAGRVVQSTAAAERLVADLGGTLGGALPVVLGAIIAAARGFAAGRCAVEPRARVRAGTGRWLAVHAAPLRHHGGGAPQVVVTIEEAGPTEVVPLVVAALGLSPRERDVVAAVLRGASTSEIAAALHLSGYTVQDHLKSVFEKAGVSSRRELVAKVFFDQYAPRLG
ncbi:helix-turn-helix transcriptional regulator [Georgenia ruanii]|nr:helix-turn-helix transcriptional regulator [Georgenia ruanii]MPV89943.1 LuxR family transcriptional regulator [Georgenia ruanii]